LRSAESLLNLVAARAPFAACSLPCQAHSSPRALNLDLSLRGQQSVSSSQCRKLSCYRGHALIAPESGTDWQNWDGTGDDADGELEFRSKMTFTCAFWRNRFKFMHLSESGTRSVDLRCSFVFGERCCELVGILEMLRLVHFVARLRGLGFRFQMLDFQIERFAMISTSRGSQMN